MMRIMTWNIHMHVDARMKPNSSRIIQTIRHHKPDIVCINEMTSEGSIYKIAKACGYHPIVHWANSEIGNAMLVRKVEDEATVYEIKNECRLDTKQLNIKGLEIRALLMVRFKAKGKLFDVGVLHLDYALEQCRIQEINVLMNLYGKEMPIGKDHTGHSIICGDFNAVTRTDFNENYLKRTNAYREQQKWELHQFKVIDDIMIQKHGYSDTFRLANPLAKDDKTITSPKSRVRIDFILWKNPTNFLSLKQVFIEQDNYASDHFPIIADFAQQ